ncbi:hypothetical protein A3F55_02115 [Candidatus Adlerbacteria bacterium RIFCSPHIGHO2_12_FULL_53_18]|uniref:Uncharacterized protein n=2 Tax=Parcubacteria group TaxID=1794811 RepID=A0A1F4XTI7_9BACT|nr:MAG: hypothetical protein A3F55_02115 [Candidatus Adlerbacteria bacterium RIFCSPHIGHO2_12_FULL_53_18]OGG51292.1 MAG: hypothetical protein A2704_01670 [Candidatus Kaiserbacteria bacterium RIFCSPHIGHO2_01_FULL_54_36b]
MFRVNQLNGFGVGAAKSISTANTASWNGASSTITIPSEKWAGDLCIIFNYAQGGTPATVVPSGFTSLANTSGSNIKIIASGKVLSGSETTVTGMTGDNDQGWACQLFRPTGFAFSTFPVNSLVSSSTSGDPPALTVSASGAAVPIIVLAQARSNTGGYTIVDSPVMTQIGGDTAPQAFYTIYDSGDTPQDHSLDMPDAGNHNLIHAFYLTF